ncbi:hypothetical protein [uncultured Marinobacter sp.]|uniref:hypothetical protein n=1 Tax=uncultured Marinobacter sp. TaxID=187379 RepID=UPI002595BF90|nr:hypothetical protein [uncultured Marinobacter sp.]
MTFPSLARKRIGQAEEPVVDALKKEFISTCEAVFGKEGEAGLPVRGGHHFSG